ARRGSWRKAARRCAPAVVVEVPPPPWRTSPSSMTGSSPARPARRARRWPRCSPEHPQGVGVVLLVADLVIVVEVELGRAVVVTELATDHRQGGQGGDVSRLAGPELGGETDLALLGGPQRQAALDRVAHQPGTEPLQQLGQR